MAHWIAVTAEATPAEAELIDALAAMLGAEGSLRHWHLPDAAAAGDAAAEIAEGARRGRLTGLLCFSRRALPLIVPGGAGLRRLFVPVTPPAPAAAEDTRDLLDRVAGLLLEKLPALDACLPQSATAAAAAAVACADIALHAPVPLQPRGPRGAAGPPSIELAFVEDADDARRFILACAEAPPGTPLRILLPEALRRDLWDVADRPGQTELLAIDPAPGQRGLGADMLVLPAGLAHRAEEAARLALRTGAALLIWPEGDGAPVLLDLEGTAHPLARLAAEPGRVAEIARAQADRAAATGAAARATWRALMVDRARPADPGLPPLVPMAGLLAAAEALAPARRLAARLAADPSDAAALLRLADTLLEEGAAAQAWRALALAHRAALATGVLPARPIPLAERLARGLAFVTEPGEEMNGAAGLAAWLAGLPEAADAIPPPPVPAPRAFAAGGVRRQPDGARAVCSAGCFLVMALPPPEEEDAPDIAIRLRLRLGPRARPAGLALHWNGVRQRAFLHRDDRGVLLTVRRAPRGTGETGLLEIMPVDDEGTIDDLVIEEAVLRPAPPPDADVQGFALDLLLRADADLFAAGAFPPGYDTPPRRALGEEVSLRLPQPVGDAASACWLLLDLAVPDAMDPSVIEADLLADGVAMPISPIEGSGSRAWYGVSLRPGLRDVALRFRNAAPVTDLGGMRMVAAWLHGLAIGRPAEEPCRRLAALHMPLAEGRTAAAGWFRPERFKGVGCRWMAGHAAIAVHGQRHSSGPRILALSGPTLPGREPPGALRLALDGAAATPVRSAATGECWVALHEVATGGTAAVTGVTILSLRAPAADLSVQDRRRAAILASGAWIIDPAADAPDGLPLGHAFAPPNAWTWEHWGEGLSGAWLPEDAVLLALRPEGATGLLLQGAAATSRAAVAALEARLDDAPLELARDTASDGSWTARASLAAAGPGVALLALRCPERADGGEAARRLMLREVRFT